MHAFLCANFFHLFLTPMTWQLECVHKGENPIDPCDPHTPGSQGHHNLVCFPWQITGIMHCGPCSFPWPLQLKPIWAAWDWVAKHKWMVSCVSTLTCRFYRTCCHTDRDKLRSRGDSRVAMRCSLCEKEFVAGTGARRWLITVLSFARRSWTICCPVEPKYKGQMYRVPWYRCYGFSNSVQRLLDLLKCLVRGPFASLASSQWSSVSKQWSHSMREVKPNERLPQGSK